MAITLRPVTPADEPFLSNLYGTTRAWEREYAGMGEAQWQAFVTSQYTARKEHYDKFFGNAQNSIVLLDGKPIGRHMVLRTENEYRLVLTELLPECRGNGVGSRLVKDVLAEGEAAGKPVRLQVAKLNGPLALCKKLGFVKTGSNDLYYQLEWRPASLGGDGAADGSETEASEEGAGERAK